MLRSSARRCGSIAAASSAGRRSSTCPLRGVLECQAAFPYKRLSDAGRSGMYERFFGLGDAPFRLTPDPRYLFLSSKHAEALAHLRLGLKESSGLVCITGDVGTGKTTLLRAFLAELGPEVTAAYIISPALSTLELLQRINREFGLPGTSTSQMELVDALHAHLLAQREAGRISVVVVDEAQAFSMDLLEQLRLLSYLETPTEKLLRVVLIGQPQLRTLLLDPAMAQLNQRITLRWHMGPLRYRETVAYVRHRLAVASEGRAALLFTVPALRLTHSLAYGVPRLINMIAHRAMLAAFVSRQPRVTRRSVVRAYREIKAVPLPGTLSVVRRAAWGAAGVAVGVGVVTLGVPLGWFTDIRRPARLETALRPAEVVAKTAPAAPAAAAPPAEPAPAEPAPAAPAANAAPEPAPVVPLPSPVAELERRLTALDPQASARVAAEALLAVWHPRQLADDETHVPDDLERVAWRRGLEDMRLTGNRSMLGVLDLPALLELRVPGASGPCYAALTGLDEHRATLAIGTTPTTIDAGLLDLFWFGQAHVLWRDFEGLGMTFGLGARGAHVARLQALLRRAGLYGGEATGEFDPATVAAVLDFQRSRLLVPDARVGRLTRIVLYAAAGGYPRPRLAGGTS